MKNNKIKINLLFWHTCFCLAMSMLLTGIFSVQIQAAELEVKQVAELEEELAPLAAQESAPALPGLSAPEAPAMPYPHTIERLAQEQKEREERYASQKQLRRQEVQKRRELRSRMQEEESKQEGEGEEKQRGEEGGKKSRTQAVLCFLDDDEIWRYDQNSTIMNTVIAAMVVEAGPIIVSSSLLARLFNEDGNHTSDMKALVKVFYDTFDSRNWIVKKIDTNLFLLLPRKNFSAMEIEQLLIGELSESETTDLEYTLGLRINHMFTLGLEESDQYSIQRYFKRNYNRFLINALEKIQVSSEQFVAAVLQNKLFVSLEYYDEEKAGYGGRGGMEKGESGQETTLQDEYQLDRLRRLTLMPEMTVYLAGHGGYNYSIADISIDTTNKLGRSLFQRVLDYFATKTKTKLVVVFSCHAAGFNSQKVLSEIKAGGGSRIYPFHLVVLATGDAPSGLVKAAIDSTFKPTVHFDTFIQKAKGDLGDFDQIKRTIFSLTSGLKVDSIPQWRPAKSALWIPLSEDNKAVIRIGKTMAATRKEPFFIESYEDSEEKKHDPQAILLAAEDIPFDIVIDPTIKKIPAFVSVLPGAVTHTIKKLTYEGEGFKPGDFLGTLEYAVQKKFIINELVIIKDGQRATFTECLIEKKGKFMIAIGKQNEVWQNLFIFEDLYAEFMRLCVSGTVSQIEQLLRLEKPDVIKELINMKNKAGNTALHIVVHDKDKQNGPAKVRLLLSYHPDVTIKNIFGKTPLDAASEYGGEGVVDLLLAFIAGDGKFAQEISQLNGEG